MVGVLDGLGERRELCVSACLCAHSCVGVRLLEGDEQGIVKALGT